MKATDFLLTRMVRRYGSYSATARALGLAPRCLRRARRAKNTQTNRHVVMAGKLLALRELLLQLRDSGVLTNAHIRDAWEATSLACPSMRASRRGTTSVFLRRRPHHAS